MPPLPFKETDSGIIVKVRATPNAAHDRIEGVELRDDAKAVLRVRVQAVPDKGKANKALIALLAKNLKIPKTSITLSAGATARIKTLTIAGDPQYLSEALKALLAPAKS